MHRSRSYENNTEFPATATTLFRWESTPDIDDFEYNTSREGLPLLAMHVEISPR
jgi:hypothetical protein